MFTKHNRHSSRRFFLTRRHWSRSLRGLGLAGLFSLTLMGGQPHAQAAGVPMPNLYGRWGFSAAGTILPPVVPTAIQAAVVGTMTFDGRGSCVVSDTLNVGGNTAVRTSKTCKYTVNPDGTGTILMEFTEDPGPIPLSFVLVDGQSEIQFARTDALPAIGVAKRQW